MRPSRETVAPRDAAGALILSADERSRLGSRPDALTLTLAFSAKESLFKALYPRVGRFFGCDAAALLSLDDTGGWLRLRQPLGCWPQGADFRFAWIETRGQVLTALSAPAPSAPAPSVPALSQARRVAPPST